MTKKNLSKRLTLLIKALRTQKRKDADRYIKEFNRTHPQSKMKHDDFQQLCFDELSEMDTELCQVFGR